MTSSPPPPATSSKSTSRTERSTHPAPQPFQPVLGRVLVTGGTGFIGRVLIERLSRMGSEVHAAVRASSSRPLPRLAGVEPHSLAMDSVDAWMPCVERVDTVFHLAGATSGARDELMRANRDITAALTTACNRCQNPPTLIVISSLSAAGPSQPGTMRRPSDAAEPVSDYGRSKLAGEVAALQYATRVPISILRPGIVFGPGDREVVKLLAPIHRLGICPLAGYHSPRLAFVHVEDCVDAIVAAVVRGSRCEGRYPQEGAGRGVYFVADDEFLSISGFKDRVLKGLGRRFALPIPFPIPILYGVAMLAERMARWRGDVSTFNRDKIREAACAGWTCDTRTTREELDWGPSRSLSDHLNAFAVDYREGIEFHA